MGTVVAVLGVVTASAAGAPAEVSIPLLLGGGEGASSRDKDPIISFTPPLPACCVAPADMLVVWR